MYNIIVNKTSGSGKSEKVWLQVEYELKAQGTKYAAYETNHKGHAGELAEMICSKAESPVYLIVVGGDGTVNEVINGMHDFDKVYVGYIPTGSGNDFARGMGITGTPVQNLQRILAQKQIRQMDLGEVWWAGCGKKRRYAISSGMGLDADVCKQSLTSGLKRVLNKLGLGSLTYLFLTIKALFTMPTASAEITFDQKIDRKLDKMIFIAGMNQRCEGGGIPMAPHANAADGQLSVCLAWGIPRWKAFFLLPVLVLGKHEKRKGFEVIDCQEFEVKINKPMVLHGDGEYFGDVTHAKFTCLPGKLNMIL